jgi:hypothetical protein
MSSSYSDVSVINPISGLITPVGNPSKSAYVPQFYHKCQNPHTKDNIPGFRRNVTFFKKNMYADVNLSLSLTVQLPIKTREGMDFWLHVFLTWTLDTSELSCLLPDHFFCRQRILVPTKLRVFEGPRVCRGTLKKRETPWTCHKNLNPFSQSLWR